ncbi:MAG: transcriptional regulator [Bacilli bacterium]|nr:transcriptional regulator [Bacilli bacterium]
MTKFDFSDVLPIIFAGNSLRILPVTRGDYVIGRFRAYQQLSIPSGISIKHMPMPYPLQSLSADNISSEQMALMAAGISGIIQDFVGLEINSPIVQTIEGRQGSGDFSFRIKNELDDKFSQIDVSNSQMEIDSGYESSDSLILVEAKQSLHSDFLVRQLFYPYMSWSQKVSKKIKLVYLVYQDGYYTLFGFEPHGNNYNGLTLVSVKKYSIRSDKITKADIDGLLSLPIESEPEVPFPQANDVGRILSLIDFYYQQEGSLTKEQITYQQDFNPRQTDYYINAMVYLGFADPDNPLELTELGWSMHEKSMRDRDLILASRILSHKVFRKTYERFGGIIFNTNLAEGVMEIMHRVELYNVNSESTFRRRSSTVISWIRWIVGLFQND